MGCNCKNSIKINDANATEQTGLEKAFIFFKKVMLFIFAICLTVIATPIVIVVILYKMIFKNGEAIIIPNKIINMLK